MNFTNLKYFLTAAKENNITSAARKLYISQQSLSNHIARLEEELNIKLFERSPKFRLTYAGTLLTKFAARTLDLYGQLESEFDDINEQRKSFLSIGVTAVRGRAVLPEILPPFHRQYPNVELNIVMDQSAALTAKLIDGELDLAIYLSPPHDPLIETVPLMTDRFCAVIPDEIYARHAPKDTKLPEDDNYLPFAACPVLLSSGTRIREATDTFFKKHGFAPSVLIEARDIDTLLELCTRGMGITFSFEYYARKKLQRMEAGREAAGAHIMPIGGREMSGELVAAYHRDRYLSHAAREMIALLGEVFGQ